MKDKACLVTALLASATLVPAGAQAKTRGGFEVGAEVFDYSYRERFEGETVAYDDGLFGGLHLSYVETIGGGLFLRGKFATAGGSVDYRSPDANGDDRIENVSQAVGQLELHIGMDFPIGGGATLSPFTGFAGRALIDESGGEVSSGGAQGYDREVGYAYIPLGAGARIPVGGKSAIVMNAQYNLIVNGSATSKLSALDPEFPDLKLDLDSGHGLEASIAYEMPVGKHALRFGPFVRHWKVARSETATFTDPDGSGEQVGFVEPRNGTTELGVRLSFVF